MQARSLTTLPRWFPLGKGCGRGLGLGLVVGLTCIAQSAVTDDGPKATVRGGSDDSGHRYLWTVTNQHSSPIVSVEFPHYHADLFIVPAGWSDEGTTHIVGRGGGDMVGVCKATVTSPNQGLAARGEATFDMRIAGAGAHIGVGSVHIEFADGTSVDISGVEIPVPEPRLARYARLAGFALLFGLFLLWASMRGRGRGNKEISDTPEPV